MFDQGMRGGITRKHDAVHEARERTVVRLHRAPKDANALCGGYAVKSFDL